MESKLKLVLLSYGLKSNKGDAKEGFRSIPVADLYLDCRGVKEAGLPSHAGGGASQTFREAVAEASPEMLISLQRVIEFSLGQIPSRRAEDLDPFKEPYRICFLCAHGIHRSVASKILVGERLIKAGYSVEIG